MGNNSVTTITQKTAKLTSETQWQDLSDKNLFKKQQEHSVDALSHNDSPRIQIHIENTAPYEAKPAQISKYAPKPNHKLYHPKQEYRPNSKSGPCHAQTNHR